MLRDGREVTGMLENRFRPIERHLIPRTVELAVSSSLIGSPDFLDDLISALESPVR